MSSSARFDHALFDYTLRYQRVPGAKYHVRPLSLLQQELLYRCDGRVTAADLADMTLATHPEIRAALTFLIIHGLVKTLMPETWLFKPSPQEQSSRLPTRPRPPQRQPVCIPGFLRRLKQLPRLYFSGDFTHGLLNRTRSAIVSKTAPPKHRDVYRY